MAEKNVPAGWYPDPLGKADERYWDGTSWTQQIQDASGSPTTAGGPTAPTVVPPPPPVVATGSNSSSRIVLGALIASLAVIGALVALLVLSGGATEPEAEPVDTAAPVTTAPATTLSATTTTMQPTTTAAIPIPAVTSPASTTTTTTTTTTTVVATGPVEQIQIRPTMITATCQGSDGIEGDLVTPVSYAPSNLVDDRPETAWRCDRDEVLNGSVTIDLRTPTRVTQLSLFGGYDKIDPFNEVDRYIQNHRVVQARWTFDDGSSVVGSYADVRRLQSIDVDVVTSTITLQVEDYWPSSGTLARDMIAFSEIDVWGIR